MATSHHEAAEEVECSGRHRWVIYTTEMNGKNTMWEVDGSMALADVYVLCKSSSAVTVTEGDLHFSLESVKALGALIAGDDSAAEKELQLVEAKAAAVCSHPALPQDFRPLCLRTNAGASLARLALVASHSDACEICESVACTGC
ncbi:guanylin-like [Anarhichas minor]|uniref:guanylin-like n=1 Tax=Anarhichas minor TaxID=65739 RepID=UPI003F733B57